MIPIISLVGRQNVGKSTLFNLLTHTRDALVSDDPGLTRDRKYGYGIESDYEFICIDTGGIIIKESNELETYIAKQSFLAIEESDVVLFILDARAGLMSEDLEIAEYLRSQEKLTFLVVNKIDGIHVDQVISDFWSIGTNAIYPISAKNGNGVTNLLKNVFFSFINDHVLKKRTNQIHRNKYEQFKSNKIFKRFWKDNFKLKNLSIKLAVVGRPNVGKSTIINCFLGENQVLSYNKPGTTRDSIYVPMLHSNNKYILIDTAGIRKNTRSLEISEKISVIRSLNSIKESNVVLLILDALEGVSSQDLSILRLILNIGRSFVIVVNKWDSIKNNLKKQKKEMIVNHFRFISFIRIHFVSALYNKGIEDLFFSVQEAYSSATSNISTASLTNIMNMAIKNHHPPAVKGRRIKLKYAHPGGYNPPVIVIHGNQVKSLSVSYKRYLTNYFRKFLGMIGTPMHLQFKEGKNPYKNSRIIKSNLKNNKAKFL